MHVNVPDLKFMLNLPATGYPEIGTRLDTADDSFFWAQGPVGGTGRSSFLLLSFRTSIWPRLPFPVHSVSHSDHSFISNCWPSLQAVVHSTGR